MPCSAALIGLPASVRSCALAWSRIISWSSSGMPSSTPITCIGICAPRSVTKSNRSVPDQRVEALRAELPDLRLQRVDLARREHPGQQLAVDVVDRRILENDRARRDLDVGLDQLDDRAARRAEGFVVHERLVHVGEAAQRVEVVLLVVVQRRFLAEPPEHRVRIGVEFDVVRVEVDILNGRVFSTDRHVSPLAGPGSRKTNGCYLSHNSGIGQRAGVNKRLIFGNLYSPLRRICFSAECRDDLGKVQGRVNARGGGAE